MLHAVLNPWYISIFMLNDALRCIPSYFGSAVKNSPCSFPFDLYIKAGMEGVGLNGKGSCYNYVVCKKKAMLSVSVVHYVLYFLEEAYCLELCCNLLPWE